MARVSRSSAAQTADIRHSDKRSNNPQASIAAEGSVPLAPKFVFSPHRTPELRFNVDGETVVDAKDLPGVAKLPDDERAALLAYIHELKNGQPWLEWSGKREELDFVVDPVVLQTHERVSSQAILSAARREDVQRSLFAAGELAADQEIEFYKHEVDWSNRLILGDSLQVMASLARRENASGRVQMVYLDPPYGIKFASNFQPQIGQRSVKDQDSDLTREPETVKAYRDTWQLGIHSYLAYLRVRLYLIKDLLHESGSVFVQISDENLHRVRCLMDEVFGPENFVSVIAVKKTAMQTDAALSSSVDYLLWFSKNLGQAKFRTLYIPKVFGGDYAAQYRWIELPNGERRRLASDEILPKDARLLRPDNLTSSHEYSLGKVEHVFEGKSYSPNARYWSTSPDGVERLSKSDRLFGTGKTLSYARFLNDFGFVPLINIWTDTGTGGYGDEKVYAVQTTTKIIARCLLMTTDPGDLVLDPTCGSGTTAVVAEQWGRRWITCDTSRVALSIARQRLMTAKFDHYRFKNGGVKGGFVLKSVPHITLKSIAQNTHLDPIFARHQPLLDACLAQCNDALLQVTPETNRVLKDKLSRKTKESGKKSITDADRRRWELPSQFEHWIVPFDTDDDWPQALQSAVSAYRQSWRAKMDEVNACIAAHADNEELVDQPEIVRGVVRVSGPFTVEAVQPPTISLGEERVLDVVENPEYDGAPEELEAFDTEAVPPVVMRDAIATAPLQTENVEAYLSQMIRLLRTDGVTFPNNKRMMFSRLEATTLGDVAVHAEGRWHAHGEEDSDADGMANVAVCIGPQYGSISVGEVIEARRRSHRENYEHLVFAGFSFDAGATAEIEHKGRSRIETHMAHIRPDVNPAMSGLLKNSGRDQLFSVFGAPRIALHRDEANNEYSIEMQGMDIYDPVKNEVTPTIAGKVAAWFIDGDYDGKCFCITQAFFPDKSAWDKLERALKGTIDADVWTQLAGTNSLAFAAGKHRQAAVKVIDPRGNEVMKVVAL